MYEISSETLLKETLLKETLLKETLSEETLSEWLEEFIFDCKLRKLSPRTIKGYKNCNLKLINYIGAQNIISRNINSKAKITPKLLTKFIQSYILSLIEQNRKETYINNLIKHYRAFFTYCVNEGYLDENPLDKLKYQKVQKTLIKTFNNDEVKRMVNFYTKPKSKSRIKFMDIRNALILIFLFDTGIRNTELCDLKLEDIKETHILIHGKGNKIRIVPITPTINKYLIKYRKARQVYITDKKTGHTKLTYQSEYLFLSQKGKRLTPEAVERVVLIAGTSVNVRKDIRISPHTCRHFYAQSQLKNGCDLFTLSRLLGHSNINITKVYLQSLEDEEIMAIGLKSSPLSNI